MNTTQKTAIALGLAATLLGAAWAQASCLPAGGFPVQEKQQSAEENFYRPSFWLTYTLDIETLEKAKDVIKAVDGFQKNVNPDVRGLSANMAGHIGSQYKELSQSMLDRLDSLKKDSHPHVQREAAFQAERIKKHWQPDSIHSGKIHTQSSYRVISIDNFEFLGVKGGPEAGEHPADCNGKTTEQCEPAIPQPIP